MTLRLWRGETGDERGGRFFFARVRHVRLPATSGTRSCVKSETYIVVVTRAPSRALSERYLFFIAPSSPAPSPANKTFLLRLRLRARARHVIIVRRSAGRARSTSRGRSGPRRWAPRYRPRGARRPRGAGCLRRSGEGLSGEHEEDRGSREETFASAEGCRFRRTSRRVTGAHHPRGGCPRATRRRRCRGGAPRASPFGPCRSSCRVSTDLV